MALARMGMPRRRYARGVASASLSLLVVKIARGRGGGVYRDRRREENIDQPVSISRINLYKLLRKLTYSDGIKGTLVLGKCEKLGSERVFRQSR